METVSISLKDLAELIATIYTFSSEEERRSTLINLKVLFGDDFFSKAVEIAKKEISK